MINFVLSQPFEKIFRNVFVFIKGHVSIKFNVRCNLTVCLEPRQRTILFHLISTDPITTENRANVVKPHSRSACGGRLAFTFDPPSSLA